MPPFARLHPTRDGHDSSETTAWDRWNYSVNTPYKQEGSYLMIVLLNNLGTSRERASAVAMGLLY